MKPGDEVIIWTPAARGNAVKMHKQRAVIESFEAEDVAVLALPGGGIYKAWTRELRPTKQPEPAAQPAAPAPIQGSLF
jgi:hypothetical protein